MYGEFYLYLIYSEQSIRVRIYQNDYLPFEILHAPNAFDKTVLNFKPLILENKNDY